MEVARPKSRPAKKVKVKPKSVLSADLNPHKQNIPSTTETNKIRNHSNSFSNGKQSNKDKENGIERINELNEEIIVNENGQEEHSSVVPGHFYQICSTKQDLDSSLAGNSSLNNSNKESPSVIIENEAVASAPVENEEARVREDICDEMSATAPLILFDEPELPSLNSLSELGPDSLDEIMGLQQDKEINSNVFLPLQEDDWDMAPNNDQSTDPIYPQLDSFSKNAEDKNTMKPFTQSELSMFYNNTLLEHADTYTDQFIALANENNEPFMTLLQNYYTTRHRLISAKNEFENQKGIVQRNFEKVFQTGQGKVQAEAYCQDRRKVSKTHYFDTCSYDNVARDTLSLSLREQRQVVGEAVTTAVFSSTVGRLHCEQFLCVAAEKYTARRNKLKQYTGNSPNLIQSSLSLQLVDESVSELKSIVNVLFVFVRRKRGKEEEKDRFWTDVQRWAALTIQHLLQSVDSPTSAGRHFSEEMFVLNHILRCPPGVHKWSDGLVQISGPSLNGGKTKDKTSLDHSLYLLYLMLRNTKGREDFLSDYKVLVVDYNGEKSNISGWTMIDEDGDEMDSLNSANFQSILLPLENDLIVLFKQIHMEAILAHVFNLQLNPNGTYKYSNDEFSSEDILASLTICDLICDILGEGLANLGRPKYKQMVRRIAQAIRNIVLLMSEHWLNYKQAAEKSSAVQEYSIYRLQLEYDEFCKRCLSRLLSVARLGIYQFIADLSYHSVSQRAAETFYLLMNVPAGVRSEVDSLVSTNYTEQEWLDFIQDPDTKLAFEEQLSTMPANEIVYLLTAFANLAQARPTTEQHLVNTICIDIFKVSFMYSSTKDICSKTGRELLSSVAAYHPYCISTLLKFVDENISTLSQIAVYAVSDLPFVLWKPTSADLNLVRAWLLGNMLGSTEYRLAQIAIQGLNFSYNNTKRCLILDHALHFTIAMVIVGTNIKIEYDKQNLGLMSMSIDHVTKVASAVRLSSGTNEQQFISWSWHILLQLKLHQSLSLPQTYSHTEEAKNSYESSVNFQVRDLNTDTTLHPLLHAIKEKSLLALYVALMTTDIGHSLDGFLTQGIDFLHTLASANHIRAVLKCLDCILPLFYKSNINLSENHRFIETLHCLLHSNNESFVSGLTNRIIPNNSVPDDTLTLLSSIIENHICRKNDISDQTAVVSYWLQLILTIPVWFKDNKLQSLADYIFKTSRNIGEKCMLECRTMLYNSYVNLIVHGHTFPTNQAPKSVVSSFLNMVTGNNHHGPPSFVESFTNQSTINIYLSMAVLEAETRYEDDSKMWMTVLMMLRSDPKMSIESAVKKSSNKLKLTHPPIQSSLALYRWGDFALNMGFDHPLLPVVWFNFFLRYIFIPSDGKSSLGCRFFGPINMLPMYNKLRLRLQNTSEYHHGLVSSNSVLSDAKAMHTIFVKLYHTYKLWLEEAKMHDHDLYLPSLPAQYHPEMLVRIRGHQTNACNEAINNSRIEKELIELSEKWVDLQKLKNAQRKHKRNSYHRQKDNGTNNTVRMTQLLRQFEPPSNIPDIYLGNPLTSPVVIESHNTLENYNSVIEAVDRDLRIITRFADNFVKTQKKHHLIDNDYMKILPDLYFMKNAELKVMIECQSAFSPTHKCCGPAEVKLRYKEKALSNIVSDKLEANRNERVAAFKEVMNEEMSQELCYVALHIEGVIKALEKNARSPSLSQDIQRVVKKSGIKLFYLLADMYSGERKSCHPTRQLLANVVELTGQVFVSQSHEQAVHILDQVLSNPASASLLSPHFAPGSKSGNSVDESIREYVKMYLKVVRVVSTTTKNNPDVLFVLLTKFDMESWLSELQPLLADRVDLLQYVIIGLIGCTSKARSHDQNNIVELNGAVSSSESPRVFANAITHKPSHSAVHEIYLNQLRCLISFRLPSTFVDAIRFLLEASRTQDITSSPWDILISISFSEKFKNNGNPQTSLFYSSCIDWNTLQLSMQLLVDYFVNYRSTDEDARSSGLYLNWQPYIKQLSQILEYICRTMLIFVRRNQLPLLYTETKLTEDQKWTTLEPVFTLFAPWIFPIMSEKEIVWPWQDCDGESAKHMIDSFKKILVDFCQGENRNVAPLLSYVWSKYANSIDQPTVPTYMYDTYHSALYELPWVLFIPDLNALDEMIKICDENNENPVRFLCHIIPKIPWRVIIDMCTVSQTVDPQSSDDDDTDSYIDVTGEILCRFAHILFVLGSKPARFQEFPELDSLFNQVQTFPWDCIESDQIEYLTNLVSDRYSWLAVLMHDGDKTLPTDTRTTALRLLKVVCKLPLVGKEKEGSQPHANSPTMPWRSVKPKNSWLKRQSYCRCVGRLICKLKHEEKVPLNVIAIYISQLVVRIMESIGLTSKNENSPSSPNDLTGVFSELFNYLNIFTENLHDCTLNAILDVICRQSVCDGCILNGNVNRNPMYCQSCVYLKSRSLTPVTILSCLTSCCNVVEYGGYSCKIIEACITSYIREVSVNQVNGEVRLNNAEVTQNHWSNILSAFLTPVANSSNFTKHSLENGCLLTLHLQSTKCYQLPGYYGNMEFLKMEIPTEEFRNKLYDLAVSDIHLISSAQHLPASESKVFVLWDHFVCICTILYKVASLQPDEGLNIYSIVDLISGLLPVLEQVSLDKVKTGILGSIGIGTQSSLSLELRVSARSLIVYLKQWLARINPESAEAIESATKAFDALKTLPVTNKAYLPCQSTISEACRILVEETNNLHHRPFFSLFVKSYFSNQFYLTFLTSATD